MSDLPPGFVLDTTTAPQASSPPVSGLPEGFVLDSAAPPAASAAPAPKTGFGSKSIIWEALKSAYSGATLPGDVYRGKVDPLSDEGIGRAFELGSIALPPSVAQGSGRSISRLASGIPQAAPVAAPSVAKTAGDFGINLTAGQRTGNPALLSRENAAFGGGLGEAAQKVAQEATARQQSEIFAARDMIGGVASRGAPLIEKPSEAGGIVGDAIKAAQQQAKQGFKSQYDTALKGNGEFAKSVFAGDDAIAPISKRIAEKLASNADNPVFIDDVLTPNANRALSELDKISGLNLARNGQPAADDIAGINLRGIDQARKKLVAYYQGAKANRDALPDQRAMQGIMKAFDTEIEDAVTKGLFSGDEKFLETWKGAQKSFSEYAKTFRSSGAGDDVGNALRKIIERDATPEETINLLIGHSKVGNTGLSVRMADRMKNILGPQSDEWSALRQAAWQRVSNVAEGKTEMGAQKLSERIYDFTNGEGASLAKRLFSPDEIKQINAYASVLKATVGKAGTTNAPNSGNRTAALARQMSGAVGAMLGASGGGVVGAGVGAGLGKGITSVADGLAAREARTLFSGDVPISIGAKLASGVKMLGSRSAVPVGNQSVGAVPR